MLTPDGVHNAVTTIRAACKGADRDPDTVRIFASVVTAPNLGDEETRALCHARAVTYLQPPAWGRSYEKLNGWNPEVMQRLREHARFGQMSGELSDLKFHRTELLEPARLIPDEWMQATSCGIGDVEDCVRIIRAFREAGADEVVSYGSTPGQNAGVVAAWRETRAPI